MKNIKIVFLGRYNPFEILSGPEKVAKRIFNNIVKINPDCIFIEYFFDGNKYNLFQKIFGNEVVRFNEAIIYRYGLLTLFKQFFALKPDVVHIVTFERFAFIAFLYKIFSKVKIVYNIHGIIEYEDIKFRRTVSSFLKMKNRLIEKVIFKYSDTLFFPSDMLFNLAKDYHGSIKPKCILFPHGVDEIFLENSCEIDYETNDSVKCVCIGGFARVEKGLKFLVNTLEKVRIKIHLFVVNTDSLENYSCSNSNVKIEFVPKMETRKYCNFLSEKHVIISSSFFDSYSIATQEAIAKGLYPIITYQTGLAEFIQNKLNASFFDYGDEEGLLTIINNLPSLLRNRDFIVSNHIAEFRNFTWENISMDYYNCYKRLLKA